MCLHARIVLATGDVVKSHNRVKITFCGNISVLPKLSSDYSLMSERGVAMFCVSADN